MKNIYAAFLAAQKGFAPALKSSTNPHFRSKYADLSACVEAVIDSLNSNGIALMQQTHESQGGVTVETVFIHESGETLSAGKLFLPSAKADAQGYGSALTYARRYSLMAACGIAPEDDDGNLASNQKAQQSKPLNASGLLESSVKAINAASSLDGAKAALMAAWASVKDESDRKKLKSEYDAKKASLEK